MKVYIVERHEYGEGGDIMGVFRSKADAEKCRNELKASFTVSCDCVSLEEVDLQ